jgi:cytochrome c peroxidase
VAYRFSSPAPPPPGFEDEPDQRFKVPSLFFVGGTPPYYHDGRASTLEELIENNGDRMGHTSHLSREDRAALVAFLRTL